MKEQKYNYDIRRLGDAQKSVIFFLGEIALSVLEFDPLLQDHIMIEVASALRLEGEREGMGVAPLACDCSEAPGGKLKVHGGDTSSKILMVVKRFAVA